MKKIKTSWIALLFILALTSATAFQCIADEHCGICDKPLDVENPSHTFISTSLKCKHKFHRHCIYKNQDNLYCPKCSHSLSEFFPEAPKNSENYYINYSLRWFTPEILKSALTCLGESWKDIYQHHNIKDFEKCSKDKRSEPNTLFSIKAEDFDEATRILHHYIHHVLYWGSPFTAKEITSRLHQRDDKKKSADFMESIRSAISERMPKAMAEEEGAFLQKLGESCRKELEEMDTPFQ